MRAVPVDRRGVIRVSWTAPTVPRGELPITGYSIRYKVRNRNMFKYWPAMSNSETEITGLKPGTVYRVYVAGVSAIGRGSYCCEGTPVLVRTYNGKLHHEQLLSCAHVLLETCTSKLCIHLYRQYIIILLL